MKLNLDKSDLLKEDLKISYDKLLDRRNQLLTKIRSAELSKTRMEFLLGKYKQGQLMIENSEI